MSAADALAYIDKSLDNVADLDPETAWTNAEVVEVLEDIRSLMLTGEPLPGLFCTECSGPYPSDSWPGSQYNGHWDTCPNRTTVSSSGGPEPLEGEK